MKKGLMLILCCSFLIANAQKANEGKYPQVRIANWGEKSYAVMDEFWDNTRMELLSQVSEVQLNKIKTYANNQNIPGALLIFDGDRKVNFDEYLKRLNSLRVYKVAEVTHVNEGVNYGEYTILAVPKQDLYWDKVVKWDTVFFVIKSKEVISDGVSQNKYPLVKIKDWNSKIYTTTEEFWESTKDEIVSKVGEQEYEKIKKYSNNENVPAAFLLFDGDRKVNFQEYLRRLGSLKVYKVVEAGMNYDGKHFDYTFLYVPYQKLYWDETAKWDTVYLIVGSHGVQ